MSIKAMIVSVGGTPQPVIKAICEYKPQFVSYFASHDSCDKVIEIDNEVKKQGVECKKEITLTDDVNDLNMCYHKAVEAVKRVIKKGYTKDETIVDYTGGTKNMSVALALASINYGFSFSYVGGEERTKNGLGIVIDGKEKIYQSINPWDFLAIEEKKQISYLFNNYHFKASKDICDRLAEKSGKLKYFFRKLGFIIDMYYKWDLFMYPQAFQSLNKKDIYELEDHEDIKVKQFAKETFDLRSYLENLSNNHNKPSIELIHDLFSNAERRFEQGKYDDAVLRLYRIVEMIAQYILIKEFEIDTSNVNLSLVPEQIREELLRYKDENNKVKIGLHQSYSLLKALNHDIGHLFEKEFNNFRKIQNARNSSFLAHGFTTPNDATYNSLKDFIIKLNFINLDRLPKFPKLEFSD